MALWIDLKALNGLLWGLLAVILVVRWLSRLRARARRRRLVRQIARARATHAPETAAPTRPHDLHDADDLP